MHTSLRCLSFVSHMDAHSSIHTAPALWPAEVRRQVPGHLLTCGKPLICITIVELVFKTSPPLRLSSYGAQAEEAKGSGSCFLVLESLMLHWLLLQFSRLRQQDSEGGMAEREMKAREEVHPSILMLQDRPTSRSSHQEPGWGR